MMSCNGRFKEDRVCELCAICNTAEHQECVQKDKDREMKLRAIEEKCMHRMIATDGFIRFYSCNKNGKGYGYLAEDCAPCSECEKYAIEDK